MKLSVYIYSYVHIYVALAVVWHKPERNVDWITYEPYDYRNASTDSMAYEFWFWQILNTTRVQIETLARQLLRML